MSIGFTFFFSPLIWIRCAPGERAAVGPDCPPVGQARALSQAGGAVQGYVLPGCPSTTNDETTRQQIAKHLGLEMIQPDSSDSDNEEA